MCLEHVLEADSVSAEHLNNIHGYK